MKNILLLGALLMTATACSQVKESQQNVPLLGQANPASEYCIQQGGQLNIKEEANGQVGYCHFADGRVVEEWALIRAKKIECIAEEAQKLVGQIVPSDAEIQQKTQSTIVRRVAMNEPVTMDYRFDRITLVVDPISQKITHASCG